MDTSDAFDGYIKEIQKNISTGFATEHTYRYALKSLMESFGGDIRAINEPRRIECGAPDYIINRGSIPVGYIEAKDIGADLHREEKSEQLKRYLNSLNNLILTDYMEFRWYVRGEHRETARIGDLTRDNKIRKAKDGTQAVAGLLQKFLAEEQPIVGRPQELAQRMADLSRMICDIIVRTFSREGEEGALHAQLEAFRKTLIPNLESAEFADMYAQTISYGLFAARLRVPDGQEFTREKAAWNLPKTNPFLRKLFSEIAGPDLDDRIAWLVDDLAHLLARSEMTEILHDFGRRIRQEDPVVHFYETFLAKYDPKKRKSRGVYYTPEPVVSYIVRSIDHILKTRFNRQMGLADQDTIILDPAVGTGTFLYFVIQRIYETLISIGQKGLWNGYVRDHLLPRVFGFELLMAPYTVAHTKLGILLQETGYDFSGDQRLGIYLTNALEEAITSTTHLWFSEFIVEEANSAGEVKRDKPVMVILGNPPYSGFSANKGKHIEDLMDRYKSAVRSERNIQPLSNDYIKFIRFAHDRIERTGHGIIGMITDNSYLSGLIHRGMREELFKSFDEIHILNLHGNSLIKETSPNGGPDENVFDIREGVAISLFVKGKDKNKPTVVKYTDLWDSRKGKEIYLSENDVEKSEWIEIKPNVTHNFFFVPKNFDLKDEYENAWILLDIFGSGDQNRDQGKLWGSGVKTNRDHLLVNIDKVILESRISILTDESLSNDDVRSKLNLEDGKYWNTNRERQKLRKSNWRQIITPYLYRPFDRRWILYQPNLIEIGRGGASKYVMHHMLSENLALLMMRQVVGDPFRHILISNTLNDMNVLASHHVSQVSFPLYLYEIHGESELDLLATNKMNRQPNLSLKFINFVKEKLKRDGSYSIRIKVTLLIT